jgi:ABC-2 type transport system permease protein
VARAQIAAGKVLGGFLVASVVLVPLVVVAALAGWLRPPLGHWPALAAILVALTLAAVGLGLALGVAVRRTRVVSMLGLNLAAYLFFLGGGFSTVAFLPPWLRGASRFVPTSYAIEGLRQTLFYPDLAGIERDIIVLVLTAIAAIAAGITALQRSWARG